MLKPLPPFITDNFALSIIVQLGEPTSAEIRAFLKNNYDLKAFPHAEQYIFAQIKSLINHGYLERRPEKKFGEARYSVTDEARPIVKKMLNEQT